MNKKYAVWSAFTSILLLAAGIGMAVAAYTEFTDSHFIRQITLDLFPHRLYEMSMIMGAFSFLLAVISVSAGICGIGSVCAGWADTKGICWKLGVGALVLFLMYIGFLVAVDAMADFPLHLVFAVFPLLYLIVLFQKAKQNKKEGK